MWWLEQSNSESILDILWDERMSTCTDVAGSQGSYMEEGMREGKKELVGMDRNLEY